MAPTSPDLTNVLLPWTPASYWRAGDYDPASLVAALKAQTPLADYADTDGNAQTRVRLDLDADPAVNVGWWVTIPTDVAESTIDTGIAAYAPPTPPPADPVATAADHASVSDSVISEKLAAIPITRSQLETALQNLLAQAAAAIPFFEEYALDPSMTSQQWTNFQALDQTTKDRLLYDTIRSLAALMRYLTGDLPTA